MNLVMQNIEPSWTSVEKETAQRVFNRAYEREIQSLMDDVREKASAISELDDLWKLNDYLNARRHEITGKYDYDYSSLLFVFAELLRDGWISIDELGSLEKDKLAKISALTRI